MAVTRDAVEDLQRLGLRQAYLILDDHPPIGRCHSVCLNQRIPKLATALGATNIQMQGFSTGDPGIATCDGFLLRCAMDYCWRFSLHPALWDLAALLELLDAGIARLPVAEQTPWQFEYLGWKEEHGIPARLMGNCYRVRRGSASAQRLRDTLLFGCYRLSRLGHRMVSRLAGPTAAGRFDLEFLGFQHASPGPYPLFWSGAMHKGGPSRIFLNYLRWSGASKMARSLEEAGEEFFRLRAHTPPQPSPMEKAAARHP
jgi:hypothetical protein